MVKKKGKLKKVLLFILIILCTSAGIGGYWFYSMAYKPNIKIIGKNKDYLYIRTGATFEDVKKQLYEKDFIYNPTSFEWISEIKKYKDHVKPGRYRLTNNMSNNDLVNMLRAGNQESVKLVFENIRTKKEFVSKIAQQLEVDSAKLMVSLEDNDFLGKYGFNSKNALALFIPNTYELFWNTSSEKFVERMADEYKKFWTDDRKNKAQKLGLSQTQISVLASIVQQETVKSDERPRVAGVYLNRLSKDMLLQADPTVIFAIGDFSIHRVLNKYKDFDSPYNTYKYKGLPPGPICLSSIPSIDAVLDREQHDYIYFCAKEDFTGYHNFARTLDQHLIYAKKYQRELDRRNIMK